MRAWHSVNHLICGKFTVLVKECGNVDCKLTNDVVSCADTKKERLFYQNSRSFLAFTCEIDAVNYYSFLQC